MIVPRLRLLLASCTVLTAAVGWICWLGVDDDDALLKPLLASALAVPLPPKARPPAPFEAFAGIAERPLFSPARKPRPLRSPLMVPVSAPPRDPAPPTLEALLVGLLISPSGSSAILRFGDGKSAVVKEGGTLQGWTLRRVSGDRVVFGLAASEREIVFRAHRVISAEAAEALASLHEPVRRRR